MFFGSLNKVTVTCRFSTHRGDAFWNSLYNNGRFYVHVAHF